MVLCLTRLDYTRRSPGNTSLKHYQKATGAEHAFQVVCTLPFENINCFGYAHPVAVPALTFLSQLV